MADSAANLPIQDSPRTQSPSGRVRILAMWLEEQGFPQVLLKPDGEILILRLSAQNRSRLLVDPNLRRQIVSRGRAIGFSRIALELSFE